MKGSTIIKALGVTIFLFMTTCNMVMAQIYCDSTGKVGIGTGSPAKVLDVLNSSITERALTQFRGEGNTAYSYDLLLSRSRANGSPNLNNDYGPGIQLRFTNNASESIIGTRITQCVLDVTDGLRRFIPHL